MRRAFPAVSVTTLWHRAASHGHSVASEQPHAVSVLLNAQAVISGNVIALRTRSAGTPPYAAKCERSQMVPRATPRRHWRKGLQRRCRIGKVADVTPVAARMPCMMGTHPSSNRASLATTPSFHLAPYLR